MPNCLTCGALCHSKYKVLNNENEVIGFNCPKCDLDNIIKWREYANNYQKKRYETPEGKLSKSKATKKYRERRYGTKD